MSLNPPDIACIGACHWDVVGYAATSMHQESDVPGKIIRSPGGVALNIAIALCRFGVSPAILSAVGRDDEGEALISYARRCGLLTDYLTQHDTRPTDVYLAIEDPNGLVAAIADAHSLEAAGAEILASFYEGRLGTPFAGTLVIDSNLTAALLKEMAEDPIFAAAALCLVPASPEKALRLVPFLTLPRATFYVNRAEAAILLGHTVDDAATAALALIQKGAQKIVVTDGPRTAAVATAKEIWTATPPLVSTTRVTGAGDTFVAAHLFAERRGDAPSVALHTALAAAAAHVSGELRP